MYLLDTHVFVWSVLEPRRLSTQTRTLLEQGIADKALHLSDISLLEISDLIADRRLVINTPLQQWLNQAITSLNLQIISLSSEIVAESHQLRQSFEGNATDRMIIATARCMNATLITADPSIVTWAEPGLVRIVKA